MLLDILQNAGGTEELWITTNHLELLPLIGEVDEIADDAEKMLLLEDTVHQGFDGIQSLLRLACDLRPVPGIEIGVITEDGADFGVHTITDHDERVVMEELWNVPGISHRYLFVCILEGGILVYRGLELQHHQRDSVDIDYGVGSAKIGSLDRQLVDDAEDIVLRIAEIDEFDVQGGLFIVAGDSETAADAFEGLTVVDIWSTIADKDERYCLPDFFVGDANMAISAV